MNFRIAKEIKLSLTASLALVVSALPFNSAAQSSIDEDQITFVKLTAEQYRNSIRDIFGESIQISGDDASSGGGVA